MRNDSPRWHTYESSWPTYNGDGFSLSEIHLGKQYIVSGLQKNMSSYMGDLPTISWPDIAMGSNYLLNLRRDRVLFVGEKSFPEGWQHDHHIAISDVSDAYHVFKLAGDAALQQLKQLINLDIDQASASLVRMVGQHELIIYRHQEEDTFLIHVLRPQAEALWQYLTTKS